MSTVLSEANQRLAKDLQTLTGENVLLCYQCKKCTLGCPSACAMRMRPHELMRALQLGLKEELYWSGTIWICQFDHVENPQSMDKIVTLLGVTALDWSFKTECCGVSMTLTQSDIVLKLTNDLLREAKEAGANAIAVCCPLCQANLDGRQRQIEEKYRTRYRLPILYITQLMDLAFGALPREVGLHKLITSPQELLGSIGLM